jgi:pimeloyl-ACP methyl ester carboxylesterase
MSSGSAPQIAGPAPDVPMNGGSTPRDVDFRQIDPAAESVSIRTTGGLVRFHLSPPVGSGGPPIVLLHGTGGSTATHYRTVFPLLAQHHQVVGVDWWEASPGSTDVGLLAQEVREATAQVLGDQRHHVVGYSLGAALAAAIADDDRNHIITLTLLAGWGRTDAHQALRHRVWRELQESGSTRSIAEFAVFNAFGRPYLNRISTSEVEGLIQARLLHPDISVEMDINSGLDIVDCLSRIHIDTLIVGGNYDQMVSIDQACLLLGHLSNSRLARVDCGHAMTTERPAEVASLILDFIEDPHRHPSGSLITSPVI